MDCIILVGGLGTRLKSISNGTPKALMPIGNSVYLDSLLKRVMQFKINNIFLSLYYKHELFLNYLKVTNYLDFIKPIVEPEPLGTGGAINYVIENTKISCPFFVMNGDSISNINLDQMLIKFNDANLKSMVGISRVDEASRYGTVLENDGVVLSFKEKGFNGTGWINNGHYIFRKEAFDGFSGIFSLENELFPKLLQNKELGAFRVAKDNFIDMGIPEEYFKLNERGFINYEDEKSNF